MPRQAVKESELAKWKAAELFKITITNLQVTAVAISINVNWHHATIGLFEAAEFIGGVTSEATNRSVDCLASDNSSVPRSVIATVIDVLVPVGVTMIFIAFWMVNTYQSKKTGLYLFRKCCLSAIAVFYISYISVTKTLVNILNCAEVHDSYTSLEEIMLDGTSDYWTVDTRLKCYEGSHAVLAGVVGWPFLFIFTFGFPLTVSYFIVKHVESDVEKGWMYEIAGFMYRAYKPKFVFWEGVIMLRKAILAVVVVFAYPLGGNLQAVLAIFVLAFASYFHTVCRPYRKEFDVLNEMEGASLLVSSINFVSSLCYNDDRVPEGARIFLTVTIFLCNIGLVSVFFMFFMTFSAEYLKTVLDRKGVPYNPSGDTFHIIRVFVFVHAFATTRDKIIRLIGCLRGRSAKHQEQAAEVEISLRQLPV